MWQRDKKWANAVGKKGSQYICSTHICHNPSMCKKHKHLWSTIKWGMLAQLTSDLRVKELKAFPLWS